MEHEPAKHPIYVWENGSQIKAWCSLSPYRRDRMALRFTAEISYYVQFESHRQGIASKLVAHSIAGCATLQIKNLFAIILERNLGSRTLLENFQFERWGFLPRVADFDGDECGHFYYGRRISKEPVPGGGVLIANRNRESKPFRLHRSDYWRASVLECASPLAL